MIESFLKIFEINNDIIGIIKVIIAFIGFIGIITKIIDFFSNWRKRQQLKIDLEILELYKKNNPKNASLIKEKVNNTIHWIYKANSKGERFWNFLYGSTIFVGFGFWSVELFTSSPDFNPWGILTLIISVSSLVFAFSNNKEGKKEDNEFYRIEFHNKGEIRAGISILLVGFILSLVLIISYQKFSYWLLVGLLLIFIGVQSIFNQIKIRKKL